MISRCFSLCLFLWSSIAMRAARARWRRQLPHGVRAAPAAHKATAITPQAPRRPMIRRSAATTCSYTCKHKHEATRANKHGSTGDLLAAVKHVARLDSTVGIRILDNDLAQANGRGVVRGGAGNDHLQARITPALLKAQQRRGATGDSRSSAPADHSGSNILPAEAAQHQASQTMRCSATPYAVLMHFMDAGCAIGPTTATTAIRVHSVRMPDRQ